MIARPPFLVLWGAAAVALSVAWTGTAEDAPTKPLTPAAARRQVGKKVVVEMKVQAAKNRLEKRGEIYLDSEPDFRDERNFAVVINREGAALFLKHDVADPAAYFRGQTVRVRGLVTVVDEVPRIEVGDPKQIELLRKPDEPKK
jgi:hypothetical protein